MKIVLRIHSKDTDMMKFPNYEFEFEDVKTEDVGKVLEAITYVTTPPKVYQELKDREKDFLSALKQQL